MKKTEFKLINTLWFNSVREFQFGNQLCVGIQNLITCLPSLINSHFIVLTVNYMTWTSGIRLFTANWWMWHFLTETLNFYSHDLFLMSSNHSNSIQSRGSIHEGYSASTQSVCTPSFTAFIYFYSYKSSCFENLSSFRTQHFSSSIPINFLHGILHFLFIQPFCFQITTLFSYIRLLHWCLHSKKAEWVSLCEYSPKESSKLLKISCISITLIYFHY